MELYQSYKYRRMMGITHEEYLNTPALTVDWDLQFDKVEQRAEANLQQK